MTNASLRFAIESCLDGAIEEGVFPCSVVGVFDSKGEGSRELIARGRPRFELEASPIQTDALFDVASITKAVPTSLLALMAIEEGLIALSDPIIDWIPEFGGPYRKEVTVANLLTHTLDFGFRLSTHKDDSPEDLLKVILSGKLKVAPGETFFYSNATSIILGLLLERAMETALDVLGRERVFGPLGMTKTTFCPSGEAIPTEIDPWRNREICGEVHDESAFTLRKVLTPGSAGLFSTGDDLLNVVEMLLGRGVFRGKRVLAQRTVEDLCVNQLTHIGESAALGWELNQKRYMGPQASNRTIGKTGFTGCVMVIDFEKNRGLVHLSNYTYPRRKSSPDRINEVRRGLADIVFA